MPKSYFAAGTPTPANDTAKPTREWIEQLLEDAVTGAPVLDLGGGDRIIERLNATPSKGDNHE